MNLTLRLVFIAGIISIFSPCIFPLIPSYFAYLAGIKVENIKTHRLKILLHAILFTIGFSSILLLVGAAVGALGEYLIIYKRTIEIIGGIIIIIFALQITGATSKIFKFLLKEKRLNFTKTIPEKFKKISPLKSLLTGVIFAIGWSPCYGPIMGAIFTLALAESSFYKGIAFFGIYSLGMALSLIILALLASHLSIITAKTKFLRKFLQILMAAILMFLGVSMLTGDIGHLANILNSLYTKYNINIF
jgi:cytochrome c-type biogenesis protein